MKEIDLEKLKELTEIKKRALCANPGPWKAVIKDGDFFVHMEKGWPIADCHGLNDAAYIAAASPDFVLALIGRMESLEKEAAWLTEVVARGCSREYDCNADCPFKDSPLAACPEPEFTDWREAARKAVGEKSAEVHTESKKFGDNAA